MPGGRRPPGPDCIGRSERGDELGGGEREGLVLEALRPCLDLYYHPQIYSFDSLDQLVQIVLISKITHHTFSS